MRESSPVLAASFADGVTSLGPDVVRIGPASTDELYFASGFLNCPGAMFTASHNPAAYNGIAVPRPAKPVGEDTGLAVIRDAVIDGVPAGAGPRARSTTRMSSPSTPHSSSRSSTSPHSGRSGSPSTRATAYGRAHRTGRARHHSGLDAASAVFRTGRDLSQPRGQPLEPSNLVDLQDYVTRTGADIGLAFDGDADRCFVVDEQGRPVSPSAVTALVAARELTREPGATVIHNLITSRTVPEVIAEKGGTAIRSRVGHPISRVDGRDRRDLRRRAFGPLLLPRFLGRGLRHAGCTARARRAGGQDRPLSELMDDYQRYAASGEINFRVEDAPARVDAVLKSFASRTISIDRLDGVTVDLDGGAWFNLRTSNTELLLRLNVEAPTGDEVNDIVVRAGEEISRTGAPDEFGARRRRPRRHRRIAGGRSRRTAALGRDGGCAGSRDGRRCRGRRVRVPGLGPAATNSDLVGCRGPAESAGPCWPLRSDLRLSNRSSPRRRCRRGSGPWMCWSSPVTIRATRSRSRRPRRRCAEVRAWWLPRRLKARCATPPQAGQPCWHLGSRSPTNSASAAISRQGLAAFGAVDPALRTDLGALADELDAEALRNSAVREVFTNPAKALAERIADARRCWPVTAPRPGPGPPRWGGPAASRRPAGCGDGPGRRAGCSAGPPGTGSPTRWTLFSTTRNSTDHCQPSRVIALALAEERPALTARTAGIDDVDLVGAEDTGEAGSAPATGARTEQQLGTLAVRLEMAAVYLRLAGDSKAVQLLSGAIRTYAWGSRTAIAEFTGRPAPTAHPEAELRLGAHPGDPARLEGPDGGFAARRHRRRPGRRVGSTVCRRFGGTPAVSGEGARRRRAAVPAGSSECRAGGGGLRARGPRRRAGQLPRCATTATAATSPNWWRLPSSRRWPDSAAAARSVR